MYKTFFSLNNGSTLMVGPLYCYSKALIRIIHEMECFVKNDIILYLLIDFCMNQCYKIENYNTICKFELWKI